MSPVIAMTAPITYAFALVFQANAIVGSEIINDQARLADTDAKSLSSLTIHAISL
jgi:hypothetical protein